MARRWIDRGRQLGKRDEPGPIITASPTWRGKPALPVASNWYQSRRNKADRPVDIGIDNVLDRPDKMPQCLSEAWPIGGAVDLPHRLGASVVGDREGRGEGQNKSRLCCAGRQYV